MPVPILAPTADAATAQAVPGACAPMPCLCHARAGVNVGLGRAGMAGMCWWGWQSRDRQAGRARQPLVQGWHLWVRYPMCQGQGVQGLTLGAPTPPQHPGSMDSQWGHPAHPSPSHPIPRDPSPSHFIPPSLGNPAPGGGSPAPGILHPTSLPWKNGEFGKQCN